MNYVKEELREKNTTIPKISKKMKEAKEKIETANDRGEVGINIKFKE